MTDHYVVQVELDRRGLTDDDVDAIYAQLGDWHVSAAETPTRNVLLTITVPADNLRQAVSTALTLTEPIGEPITVNAMTEATRDARQYWAELPPLVSVPEAADILGFTRQYVHQLISEGKLPATRVGRDSIIVRSALGPFMPRDKVAELT